MPSAIVVAPAPQTLQHPSPSSSPPSTVNTRIQTMNEDTDRLETALRIGRKCCAALDRGDFFAAFGLDPDTASVADLGGAWRRLAVHFHVDRIKNPHLNAMFTRMTQVRDELLAPGAFDAARTRAFYMRDQQRRSQQQQQQQTPVPASAMRGNGGAYAPTYVDLSPGERRRARDPLNARVAVQDELLTATLTPDRVRSIFAQQKFVPTRCSGVGGRGFGCCPAGQHVNTPSPPSPVAQTAAKAAARDAAAAQCQPARNAASILQRMYARCSDNPVPGQPVPAATACPSDDVAGAPAAKRNRLL